MADDRADGLNAKIVFPAGSLPATAKTVEITTSVQGDPNYNDTFPGQFVGVPTGGVAGPLLSFGIAAITARDDAGNKLQLDPALPATLTIPVPQVNPPLDPQIPLWRLNETTGIWEQVGVATRHDGPPVVYTAEVSHLSTFNIDICTAADGLKSIAVDYTSNPEYRDTNYPDTAMLPVATLDALPKIAGAWIQVTMGKWAGTGNADGIGVLVLSPPTGYNPSTLTGSKMGYRDSRVFNYSHVGNQAVVYVGLQKDVTWVPPDTGDVGTIIK